MQNTRNAYCCGVCDPIKVLLFISRCDGEIHLQEADEILRYADHLARLSDGRSLNYSADDLVTWLERQRPRWHHVERSLLSMRDWSLGQRRDFVTALRCVIEADGVIDDNEVAAYEEVGRLLDTG